MIPLKCAEIAAQLSEADTEAVNVAMDAYEETGVNDIAKLAVADVLSQAETEKSEYLDLINKQYPDLAAVPTISKKETTEPEKVKPDDAKNIDRLISTGEQLYSQSGRALSKVPKIDATTSRKITNTIKRVNAWLLHEAQQEAIGQDYLTTLLSAIDLKNISQSDQDTLNDVVFGDVDGPGPANRKAPEVVEEKPDQETTEQKEAKTKFNNIVGRIGQLRDKSELLNNDIGDVDTYAHVINLLDGKAKDLQNTIASYESLVDGKGIASVYSSLMGLRRDVSTGRVNRNWIPQKPQEAKKVDADQVSKIEDVGEDRAEYGKVTDTIAEDNDTAEYTDVKSPDPEKPQLDMFTDEPMFPGKKAEFNHATEAIQTGTFDISIDEVRTPEHAASIMRPLAEEAAENFATLVLDKNKKPIAVMRQFFGTVDGASVYPREVATLAHMIPGAKHLWFSHNHPSGVTDPSQADKQITNRLVESLKDTGIEVEGHVIMGYGTATSPVMSSAFDAQGENEYSFAVADKPSITTVPEYRGRKLVKFSEPGEVLTSPKATKIFIADKPEGLHLLDNRNRVIGYSPLSMANIALNKTGKSGWRAELIRAIGQSNAAAIIIKTDELNNRNKRAMNALKDAAALIDVRVLDAIDNNGDSAAESGILEEPAMYYQRGAKGIGMRVSQVQRIVDRVLKEYKGAQAARIVVRKDDVHAFGSKIEGKPVKGGFDPDTNTISILAHNMNDEADVLKTIRHEIFTHFGLRQLFNETELMEFLDAVRDARGKNDEIANIYESVIKAYPYLVTEPYKLAEEVVARVSEGNLKTPLMDKVRALIIKLLRRIGLAKAPITRAEINVMIDKSAANLRAELYNPRIISGDQMYVADKDGTGSGGFMFQRQNEDYETARGKVGKKGRTATLRERYEEIKGTLGLRFRQGVVDRYASLMKLDDTVWKLARGTHHVSGAVEAAFKYGKIFLDADGALDIDTAGKGLAETLSPLGSEIDDFMFWMIGNRAYQLKKEDREHLFTDAEIAAFRSRNQGTMEDGRDRGKVYEQARKDLMDFQESILEIGIKTDTISREEADTWNKEFYIPFYRILEDKDGSDRVRGAQTLDGLTGQTAIKRLKGGTKNINDPLANILMNWHHILSASMKNQAAAAIVLEATEAGIMQPVNEKQRKYKEGDPHAKSIKSDKAFFVRVNGKKEWFDIIQDVENPIVPPDLVLESLTMLNQPTWNNAGMKALRMFKRIFTIGVTASPEFRIANLFRDTIHSVAVGKQNYNVFDNIYEGWKGTKVGSDVEKRMMAGGGTVHFGLQYGDDPEAARLLIKEHIDAETILTDEHGMKKYNHALKGMWIKWRDFGNKIENVNRAALYKKRTGEGVSHFQSAHESRDLLDFFQGGSWPAVRFLTQSVPFLNARLQGLDKMYRAGITPEQKKQLYIVLGTYVTASLALYLLYRDDDDFKAREEWDKDAYHWFKLPGGIAARFPRPFEVGAIATIAERALEFAIDDDAHIDLFAERLGHVFWQTFEFDPVPQAARPVLDIYANKNPFTKRPIESLGMAKLTPSERRYAYTSETAIGMSKGLGEIPWEKIHLSPIQIEYLVNGFLGWAGSFSLGAIDNLITRPITERELPFMGESRPERMIDEWPITKRFIQTLPIKRTKYTTMFYENMKEINTVYADLANYRKLGELEKARDIMLENRDKIGLRKIYQSASKKMTQINNQLRRARGNKKLTSKQKMVEIDRLRRLKNAIAKRIIEKTQDRLRD